MVAPAFRMPDDDVSAARIPKHRCGNVAGVGALFIPMAVLRRHGDIAAFQNVSHGAQSCEWRRHHHFAMVYLSEPRAEIIHKLHRFTNGFVHFPIAGNYGFSHFSSNGTEVRAGRPSDFYFFSVSASTPGSFIPERNSRVAPPPVEMWLIWDSTPDLATAATESPPPTMLRAEESATACAMARVPAANLSISNTPMGPFQTIVFAVEISRLYSEIVAGPMSTPIFPSGIARPFTTSVAAAASTLSATT